MLNSTEGNVLRYVKNTNGGATKANFIEDHEPIGNSLWINLSDEWHEGHGYITIDSGGKIALTEKGKKALGGV